MPVLGTQIESETVHTGFVGGESNWVSSSRVVKFPNGTLVTAATKNAASSTLFFYYSTDGGSTWTECATSHNTGSQALIAPTLAINPENTKLYVFVGRDGSSQLGAVYRFAWSGTDVTYESSRNLSNAPTSTHHPWGIMVCTSPSNSSFDDIVVCFNESASASGWEVLRFNKTTTGTSSVAAAVGFLGTAAGGNYMVWPFDAATPHSSNAADRGVHIVSLQGGSMGVNKIYWNGSTWVAAGNVTRTPTGWGSSSYPGGAFYNPIDGYYYASHMLSTKVMEVARQTPALAHSAAWSKRTSSSAWALTPHGAYKGYSYDTAGDRFLVVKTDNGADMIATAEYNPASDTWGAWNQLIDSGNAYAILTTSGWSVHGGAAPFMLLESSSGSYRSEWYGLVASATAFTGFGIPIGI